MPKEKVRQNLYKLIEQYYRILKKQYKKETHDYKIIEQVPSELKQNILNYETSIFKNIKLKQIPFTQLFNLNQKTIYALSPLETKILRNYVGIYDNGQKQSVEEVSKKLNITTSRVSATLKRIMDIFETETSQKLIINERNKEIKDRIFNKEFKEQILNSDIRFLNITDNFIEILNSENINTVGDIIKLTEDKIEKINIEYGYYNSLKIIPNRLIEEIHSLGLRFEDEIIISQMFHNFDGVIIDSNSTIGNTFNTIKDAISARQFEPELLSRLNLEDNFKIDTKINKGYMQDKYIDMSEELLVYRAEMQKNKIKEKNYECRKAYYANNN